MAFKKTEGARVKVGPTGIPDFSGYTRAAAEYDSVAAAAYGLGADLRKQKLNEMILEAEAAGRSAGATYKKDADGNNILVPLTNLNMDQAIEDQVFGESEKNALRASYRKAALQTYSASISLDAGKAAEIALKKNPNDPDAIRGALDGFIETLGVEDEVLEYVMPSIVTQFTERETRANAQMILDSREHTEKVHLNNVDDVAAKLATIVAKGAPNQVLAEGHREMIADLNKSLEGSYEALETVGYEPYQIKALREGVNQLVAQKSSTAHIERIYIETGSLSQAQQEIMTVYKEFDGDPSIDAKAVSDAMSNHLTNLHAINTNRIAETNKRQTNNAHSLSLDIAMGEVTEPTQILSADINEGQKATLINSLNGKIQNRTNQKKARAADIRAMNKKNFEGYMIPLEVPSAYDQDTIEASMVSISAMWKDGQLEPDEYVKYLKAVNENVGSIVKAEGDIAFAQIENMMSESYGYALNPDFFREKTDQLRDAGFIGTGKFASMTEKQWEERILRYQDERAKFKDDGLELLQARGAAMDDHASPAQIKLIKDDITTDFKVDQATGSIFNHSDPQAREDNFELAVRSFLAFGVMPDEVSAVLGDLSSAADRSEDAFNIKLQIFDKLFTSIKNGTARQGTTALGMGEFDAIRKMNNAGIDTLEYEIARIKGFKAYRDASNAALQGSLNPQRLLTAVDQQFPDLEAAIKRVFPAAVEGSGFGESLLNQFGWTQRDDVREQTLVDSLIASAPIGARNVADAYIGDPRLLEMVKLEVIKTFTSKRMPVDATDEVMAIAVRNAVVNLAEDGQGNALVGVSVDSNNNAFWTVYPWLSNAAKSIGDRPIAGKSVQEAVYRDIRDKALSPNVAIAPRLREIIQDEDNPIFLTPNTFAGPVQTYSVQVRDVDTGEVSTILPSYYYDYKFSRDNAAYVLALENIGNSAVESWLYNVNILKPSILRSAINGLNNEYKLYNDPLAVEAAIAFFAENNPFYRFEYDYNEGAHIDVAIMGKFLNGELETDQDIINLKRKMEAEANE